MSIHSHRATRGKRGKAGAAGAEGAEGGASRHYGGGLTVYCAKIRCVSVCGQCVCVCMCVCVCCHVCLSYVVVLLLCVGVVRRAMRAGESVHVNVPSVSQLLTH